MATVDTVTTARGRRRQPLAIVTDIMATVVIEDMEAMEAMEDMVDTAMARERQNQAITAVAITATEAMADTVDMVDTVDTADMVDTAMESERLILVTVTRATVVDTAATDMATAIMDKSVQVQEFSA